MGGGFTGGGGFHSSPGFSGGFGSGRGIGFAAPRANFPTNFGGPPRLSIPSRSFSSYPRAGFGRGFGAGYGANYRAGYPGGRAAYGQRSPQMAGRRPYPGRGSWGGGKSPWGRPPGRYVYRRPYFYSNATYLTYPWLSYWPYFGNDYDDWDEGDYSDQGGADTQSSDVENGGYANGGYAPDQAPEPEQPGYAPPEYPSPAAAAPSPEPAVTLVFKDGHSQQIRNYAATRTTLFLLDNASSGRTPQIPLDEIDVAATERVNREAGLNFSLPAGN